MSQDSLIHAHQISFSYRLETQLVPVLKDLSLSVRKGEMLAIKGPSGSGKSTFLYLLSGLLKPDSGDIFFNGQNLNLLSPAHQAQLRNQQIGFVFQQFHLLPKLTVEENILLPLQYRKSGSTTEHTDRGRELAEQLGLNPVLNHRPNQLSGGQQQRVAIARALLSDPSVILADEPTGNLDSVNSKQILNLFQKLNQQGKTIILITHDAEVANTCQRIVELRDGQWVTSSEIESKPIHHHQATPDPSPTLARNIKLALPVALSNLYQNKVRSLLTLLGITIGIASVLAMLTLGNATKKSILASYETLGVNRISIYAHRNWYLRASDKTRGSFRQLVYESDILPLFKLFPSVEFASPVYEMQVEGVHFGGRSFEEQPRVFGVNEHFLRMSERDLIAGQPFSFFHMQNRSPVCIVGFDIAKKLFSGNPLGKLMIINPDSNFAQSCRIRGVLAQRKTNDEWSKPNAEIYVPHTLFPFMSPPYHSRLQNVSVSLKSGSPIEANSKMIQAYLEKKYAPSAKINVGSYEIIIEQMKRALNAFIVLLAAIAIISLIVGAMGITNMMLVSVVERYREIGIRKAIGATPMDIRTQFLVESLFLCSISGLVGLVVGFAVYETALFAAAQLFPKTMSFTWTLDPWATIISVLSILIVGFVSGTFPALKAERLSVIEALRSE